MSLPEFNALMTHTIRIRKRQRDASGNFSDVSFSDVKGFCQFGNKLITTKKDETINVTAIIFLKEDCGIDINHEYWMIDQITPYSVLNMEVLQIDTIDDPRTGNTDHFELLVR